MIVRLDKKFQKDLKKLKNNKQLLRRIDARIVDVSNLIAELDSIDEAVKVIPSIRKMVNYTYHYRIRVGDYRLGVFFDVDYDAEEKALVFQRCLHRDNIYDDFPKD